MKTIFKFLLILFFLQSMLYATSDNKLNFVINNLHKVYDNVTTFKSDFKQINFFSSVNQVQEFYGTLYLKRPDKMRWDYIKPEVESIISNGKKIWYYYPGENQVNYADLKGKAKENDLIFLLLQGVRKVENSFYLKLIEGNDNKNFYYLQLTPKKPNTQIKKIILTISKKDFNIIVSHVFYISNDIAKVMFLNSKINIKIDDTMFNFVPAPGCEIFKIPAYQ